jgi:peptidoglycan/xylan/chitin deacetylase (PgdA/CDA1 family)
VKGAPRLIGAASGATTHRKMHVPPRLVGVLCLALASAAVGCGSSGPTSATGAAGTTGVAGTTGAAGAAGTTGAAGIGAAGAKGGASDLPTPAGAATVPRPAGATASLKVLPWAGFKAAVTYTFDDAQPSQIDHWPDLQATGIAATYYITTSSNWYAGFDATWNEVFAAGNELGNHTVNHCNFNLSGCTKPLASAAAEIDDATTYIKSKLGPPDVWTMAYPFGDAGYKALAQARFFLARGTGGGMVAPGDNTDPFNLPCVAAAGGEAATVFDASIDSALAQGKWLIFLFHSLLPDAQNWFAGVDVASVTGSITHAKSLPDVWIGTVRDVGAYWLGQKTVAAVTAKAAGAGMTWTWTLPAHFPPARFLRVTVGGGTLTQGGETLTWDGHGYYEVALDTGSLSWAP